MILGIYGSGGLGKELVDLAEETNAIQKKWESIIFIDDVIQEKEFYGIPVYSFQEVIADSDLRSRLEVVIALGTPSDREMLYNKVKAHGIALGNLISTKATISRSAKIGEGVIIQNAYLDSNVTIGDNCWIGYHAIVGHDTQIGNSTIMVAHGIICGKCSIGERVYIAPSASICDGVTVGDDSLVALSAALFKSMGKESKAIGNPAVISPRKLNKPLFSSNR